MVPIRSVGIAVCCAVAVWWTCVQPAAAARLEDIRIGTHEGFSRIVFDFDDVSEYKEPQVSTEGIASVVFPGGTVGDVLPLERPEKKDKLIDSVELLTKGKALVVTIATRSRNFEVRSFSLVNPDRVVLDFYWPSGKAAPPATAGQGPATRTGGGEIWEKPIASEENASEEAAEHVSETQALRSSPADQAVEPVSLNKEPGKEEIAETKESSVAFSQFDRIQVGLMILLVVLNIVIVTILAILTVNVLKWRRLEALSEHDTASGLFDDNIISIDSRIQEELKKYQRIR
jgi:hypothetical protein